MQNWKNLRFNSEKMFSELNKRTDKIIVDLENISKIPEIIAVKKGQLIEGTTNTENEKLNLAAELNKSEKAYQQINKQLKIVEEKNDDSKRK